MKYMLFILISSLLLEIAYEQCYTENPSSADTCHGKKGDGYKCCYVEYKNNKMSDYSTLCIEVIKDDIKSGHHEATILSIEEGNYTGSNWNETIMEKFKDYSTISEFDCKSNYMTKSLIFLSSLIILFI